MRFRLIGRIRVAAGWPRWRAVASRPHRAARRSGARRTTTRRPCQAACAAAAQESIRVHPAPVLHGDARSRGRRGPQPLLRLPPASGGAELRRRQRSAAVVSPAVGRGAEPLAQPVRAAGRARAARRAIEQVLARVRESNYFDAAGDIPLARRLRALPAAWDGENDHRWNGYVPDARFHFDERGFDRSRRRQRDRLARVRLHAVSSAGSCRPTARWTTC